jgi:hypothetical protein
MPGKADEAARCGGSVTFPSGTGDDGRTARLDRVPGPHSMADRMPLAIAAWFILSVTNTSATIAATQQPALNCHVLVGEQ